MGELANHLWQSTLVASVAAVLAYRLRRSHARIRYWVWWAASVKFLVPFAMLAALGSQFPSLPAGPQAVAPAVATAVAQVHEPFSADLFTARPEPSGREGTGWRSIAVAIWALGVVAIAWIRLQLWRRVRRVVRGSEPTDIIGIAVPPPVRVRTAAGLLEPGVVGIVRPILLLPRGLQDYLPPGQLRAVIAHELCHVRRHDNFTAAIHMAVEALFWFHPLVWWIGARLVEERERACDEHVLRECADPGTYAEGILNVCRRYVEAPIMCIAGVGGSDLRKRIDAIVANRIGVSLTAAQRGALTLVVLAAFLLPVLAGAVVRPALAAQLPAPDPQAAEPPIIEVASVRPNTSGSGSMSVGWQPGGGFTALNYPLESLIQSAFDFRDSRLIGVPAWASSARFDLVVKARRDLALEERPELLQALLRERFGLVAHREFREMPIYALVVARSDRRLGPDLRVSDIDCSPAARAAGAGTLGAGAGQSAALPNRPTCGSFSNGSSLIAGGITMAVLASSLTRRVDRVVVDRTGLDGFFDVDLTWARATAPSDDGPSIFTAVQEQLGLRLEPARGPVEVLVIDSIDRPTAN